MLYEKNCRTLRLTPICITPLYINIHIEKVWELFHQTIHNELGDKGTKEFHYLYFIF